QASKICDQEDVADLGCSESLEKSAQPGPIINGGAILAAVAEDEVVEDPPAPGSRSITAVSDLELDVSAIRRRRPSIDRTANWTRVVKVFDVHCLSPNNVVGRSVVGIQRTTVAA